jgi:hypothetical protein
LFFESVKQAGSIHYRVILACGRHASERSCQLCLFVPCLYLYGMSAILHVFRPWLVLDLTYYGYTGESPPTPTQPQVPSSHHWKSKCGEDIDSPMSLQYHQETEDLQARFWSTGESRAGMFSILVTLINLTVWLDPTRTFNGG